MTLRVNGQAITEEAIQYELVRLVKFYSQHMSEAEVRNQLDLLRQKAKEQAVGAKLLIDEANAMDIEVPAGEVDDRLAEMRENAGGANAFRDLLRNQGLSVDLVRAGIEQGRKVDLLVAKLTEGVQDPMEADLQAHFKAHADEYRVPEKAQAQHILIRVDKDNPEDCSVARSKLLGIKQRIEDGVDFADLAASYSDCPSGKQAGGSLGWISRGTMVDEFDQAAFSLAVGALSDVVETSLGFHLIRKTAEEDSRPAEYDEVIDKIRDFLRHVARGEALAAHVAELTAKAVIEED